MIHLFTNLKAGGGFHDGIQRIEGSTNYDAIRIIENNSGLFFKLNDATFSRSTFVHEGENGNTFIPLTKVLDCKQELTTSVANLVGTPVKFQSPLVYFVMGGSATGGSVLSSNDQVLTVTIQGQCGTTYFAEYNSHYDLRWGDTHPVLGEHLIPADFAPVFTDWTDWTACSVTCGDGIRTRSRTCQSFCSGVTIADTDESEVCDMGGPCSSPCINYQATNQCGNSGDLMQTTSISPTPLGFADTSYEAVGGYGSCASLCIGNSACAQFDWIQLNNDGSGTCKLFSSG